MKIRYAIITIAALALLSFVPPAGKIEFNYPTDKKAVITMTTDRFKNMEKEAQGTDYYYHGESDNGIICSVLFYKLNADEVTQLVDAPAKILGFPEIALPIRKPILLPTRRRKTWKAMNKDGAILRQTSCFGRQT